MVAATVAAGNVSGVPIVTPKGTLVVQPKTGWVDDGDYAYDPSKPATSTPSYVRLPPTWAYGLVRHVCLNVGIQEVVDVDQTTGAVTPNTAAWKALLEPVYALNATLPAHHRLTVHVRDHWGERAMPLISKWTGSVRLTDGSFGKDAQCPRWFAAGATAYRDLYERIWAVRARMIDAEPVVGSVNSPMAAMWYPEPFLRFAKSIIIPADGSTPAYLNEDSLADNGYTAAEDKDFMVWAATIPGRYVQKKIVYLALNPTVLPGEASADMPWMWQVADAHLASLPKWRAGLENYSMRMSYMSGPGNYETMYAGIAARECWRSTQMARPHRVADTQDGDTYCGWPEVAAETAAWGFHAVETTGTAAQAGGAANGWPDTYVGRQADMNTTDAVFTSTIHQTRTRP